MNRDQLAELVLELVTGIAPDVDPASVIPGIDFRDQFDFDSMDQLNFVLGLHRRLGVDVPEADYPLLATLDGCVAYLGRALPTAALSAGCAPGDNP
jgi:acyl carrier protein